jgi:hypothetical protein
MQSFLKYFALGFCCLFGAGMLKAYLESHSVLGDNWLKHVIIEHTSVRADTVRFKQIVEENHWDALWMAPLTICYECKGQVLYTLDLGSGVLIPTKHAVNTKTVFTPNLLLANASVISWIISGATGGWTVKDVATALVRSPEIRVNWKTLAYVLGSLTGYPLGYLAGAKISPPCLSKQITSQFDKPEYLAILRRDTYTSLLADDYIIFDGDFSKPTPLVSVLRPLKEYLARPTQDPMIDEIPLFPRRVIGSVGPQPELPQAQRTRIEAERRHTMEARLKSLLVAHLRAIYTLQQPTSIPGERDFRRALLLRMELRALCKEDPMLLRRIFPLTKSAELVTSMEVLHRNKHWP